MQPKVKIINSGYGPAAASLLRANGFDVVLIDSDSITTRSFTAWRCRCAPGQDLDEESELVDAETPEAAAEIFAKEYVADVLVAGGALDVWVEGLDSHHSYRVVGTCQVSATRGSPTFDSVFTLSEDS